MKKIVLILMLCMAMLFGTTIVLAVPTKSTIPDSADSTQTGSVNTAENSKNTGKGDSANVDTTDTSQGAADNAGQGKIAADGNSEKKSSIQDGVKAGEDEITQSDDSQAREQQEHKRAAWLDWLIKNAFNIIIVILLISIIFLIWDHIGGLVDEQKNVKRNLKALTEEVSSNQSSLLDEIRKLKDSVKRDNRNIQDILENSSGYMDQIYTLEPVKPAPSAPPKTDLERYNEVINSVADLSLAGFLAIDLSNENNLIEVSNSHGGNTKFYAIRSANNDFLVYPSKNISMGQMSGIYSFWFDINRNGSSRIVLRNPCKINRNLTSGKFEILEKGNVDIY